MTPTFFDPRGEINVSRNHLPHWQQAGATYFVTFRLADSVPRVQLRQWQEERGSWIKFNPRPWNAEQEREYWDRFGLTIDRWLDKHQGSCALRERSVQNIMAAVFMRFDAKRYEQHSWVVMPNHVHALFSVKGDWALEKILQNWKGSTAREVNRYREVNGTLWQKDYFDRVIRSNEHFWHCVKYIRQNPAHLARGDYVLWESEEIQKALDA